MEWLCGWMEKGLSDILSSALLCISFLLAGFCAFQYIGPIGGIETSLHQILVSAIELSHPFPSTTLERHRPFQTGHQPGWLVIREEYALGCVQVSRKYYS